MKKVANLFSQNSSCKQKIHIQYQGNNFDSRTHGSLTPVSMTVNEGGVSLLNQQISNTSLNTNQQTVISTQKKPKIQLKANTNRSITPILSSQRINHSLNSSVISPACKNNFNNNITPPNNIMNTKQIHQQISQQNNNNNLNHYQKKGFLKIEAPDDEQSQYCLEQLVSPNFQPQPGSTISMQRRLSKQNFVQGGAGGGGSTTKFFSGQSQNNQPYNQYRTNSNSSNSLFRKNSTPINQTNLMMQQSPSALSTNNHFNNNSQGSNNYDDISQTIKKQNHQQKQSTNSKKIMNDSLNMISKSRNKFLNKSFQQNTSNSSGTRNGQAISAGGDSSSASKLSAKLGQNVMGQNLSLRKLSQEHRLGGGGPERSIKKMSITASQSDMLCLQENNNDEFDQSYGKLPIHNFMANSVKGSRNNNNNIGLKKWQTNGNQENRHELSSSKAFGELSGTRNIITSLQNIGPIFPPQIPNESILSTTNKKGTFKINLKTSKGLGGQSTIQTPLSREKTMFQQSATNKNFNMQQQQLNQSSSGNNFMLKAGFNAGSGVGGVLSFKRNSGSEKVGNLMIDQQQLTKQTQPQSVNKIMLIDNGKQEIINQQ